MLSLRAGDMQFWKHKSLKQMSRAEWEMLCDGCAKCCLHKYEDEGSGTLYYTGIACRYLDPATCRCVRYDRRSELVSDCIRLGPHNLRDIYFMPATCAYRLAMEGKDLPRWHHLVSGDAGSIHRAGMSVKGRVISESSVDPADWERYVVDWCD